MPDMWVHPHYNHFSLPACRCVGPRLGVVRRWRVPKRVDSCCQGCGRCFLRGSHRSGWVQSRLWRSWYSLGIWIQVDHNISLSWWFERPYCSLVRNLLEVRGALPIHNVYIYIYSGYGYNGYVVYIMDLYTYVYLYVCVFIYIDLS